MSDPQDEIRDLRAPNHWWADNELIDDFGEAIGAHAIAVYTVLCRHADTHGICHPAIPTIARKIALSEPTVRKALKVLEHHRLVAITERMGTANGKPIHLSNIYQLLKVKGNKPIPFAPDDQEGVVKDVDQGGGKSASPGGMVKDVDQGAKRRLPGVVKDVDPNNTQVNKTQLTKQINDSNAYAFGKTGVLPDETKPVSVRDLDDGETDVLLKQTIGQIKAQLDGLTTQAITALGLAEKARERPRQGLITALRAELNQRKGRVLVARDHVTDLASALDLMDRHENDKRYTVHGGYGAILAALYSVHYAADKVAVYPAKPSFLAGMTKKVSGGARCVAETMAASDPSPEGDPHGKLNAYLTVSAARKASEKGRDGHGALYERHTQGQSSERSGIVVDHPTVQRSGAQNAGPEQNAVGTGSELLGRGSRPTADESGPPLAAKPSPTGNPYKFNSPAYWQFEKDKNNRERGIDGGVKYARA